MVILILAFPPGFISNGRFYDTWVVAAGILIIIFGQSLRAMVIGLVYIKRGGVNKKIYADTLATTGIFAHCRNPLYLANLMIVLGLLVVHNNMWVYILGISFFLVSYSAIVLAEEEFLRQKFQDEYLEYCNRTGRWSFRLRGLGQTFSEMKFNWRRVLLKDYSTVMTWSIALAIILARKTVTLKGLNNSGTSLGCLFLVLILVLSTGLYIRTLKKSGRLTENR